METSTGIDRVVVLRGRRLGPHFHDLRAIAPNRPHAEVSDWCGNAVTLVEKRKLSCAARKYAMPTT